MRVHEIIIKTGVALSKLGVSIKTLPRYSTIHKALGQRSQRRNPKRASRFTKDLAQLLLRWSTPAAGSSSKFEKESQAFKDE